MHPFDYGRGQRPHLEGVIRLMKLLPGGPIGFGGMDGTGRGKMHAYGKSCHQRGQCENSKSHATIGVVHTDTETSTVSASPA